LAARHDRSEDGRVMPFPSSSRGRPPRPLPGARIISRRLPQWRANPNTLSSSSSSWP
jgi:hypothetical protein